MRSKEKRCSIRKMTGKTLVGLALLALCLVCMPQAAYARGGQKSVLKVREITTDVLDELNLKGYKKLMIVAHPDDDTIWGGAHLLEDKYLVVCLTNAYNYVRANEFTNAMKTSGDKGIIMYYPDLVSNGWGAMQKDQWKSCRENIREDLDVLLTYKNWTEIVTHNPDGEYGHIHHRLTSRLVKAAARQNTAMKKLYYFGTYYKKYQLPRAKKHLVQLSWKTRTSKNRMCSVYQSQSGVIQTLSHMLPYENWIPASEW